MKSETILVLLGALVMYAVIGLAVYSALTRASDGASQIEVHNNAYREGMPYAYDNVVFCNASPENEGMRLAKIMNKTEVSDIQCTE